MSVPAARIARRSIISPTSFISRGAIDRRRRVDMRSSAAKERLSRTDIGSISPSVLRSSGMSAMPIALRLRRVRARGRDRRARDPDFARDAAQDAEQREQQFALALPVEAAESDDFARLGGERDVAQPVGPAQVPDLEQRRLRPFARAAGFGGNTWLYSRPIIISTTSSSVFVPAA